MNSYIMKINALKIKNQLLNWHLGSIGIYVFYINSVDSHFFISQYFERKEYVTNFKRKEANQNIIRMWFLKDGKKSGFSTHH